jgi:hypothetical protein
MAKKKLLGHGIRVKFGSNFVGFVKTLKMAGMSRESVNVTTLEDEVEDFLDADPPLIKPITFTAFWDPDDSTDEDIDESFFNDDIDEREVIFEFQYRTTSTGTPPAASTWTYKYKRYTGRIIDIEPTEIGGKGEFMRTITLQPTKKPESGTVV